MLMPYPITITTTATTRINNAVVPSIGAPPCARSAGQPMPLLAFSVCRRPKQSQQLPAQQARCGAAADDFLSLRAGRFPASRHHFIGLIPQMQPDALEDA